MYCKIETNTIIQGPCDLPRSHANISGFNLLDDATLKTFNWLPYIDPGQPEHNTNTQHVTQDMSISEDAVTRTYTIVDYTEEELAANLATAKANKIVQVAADRYDIEVGGVQYTEDETTYTILSDRDSISRLKETLDEIAAGNVSTVNWKCANNTWLTITSTNAAAIKTAMLTHILTCFNAEKTAQESIAELTTIAAVNAYEFTIG